MIEVGLLTPTGFVVALFAARTEFIFVRILFLVTGNTGRRQFFAIDVPRVAGITFDFLVRAAKRIFGFVVIEPRGLPFDLVVARLTFRAIPAGMNVLQSVARHAGTREVLVDLADMTGCAGNVFVGALQRELGLAVIERLYLPPLRLAMTSFALFAEPPFMWVDRLVTIEAPPRRLSINRLRQVTGLATDGLVCVLELKVRKVVIECFSVELIDIGSSPFVVGVTVPALLLQCLRLSPVETPPRLAIRRGLLVAVEA